MLKIKFIVVDKTRLPFLKQGESFFLERLARYAQFQWIEVKPEKAKKGRPEEEIIKKEEDAVLKKLAPGDYLVALDRSGKQFGSREFSEWLKDLSTRVDGWTCFVIGGPLGFSKNLVRRADAVLSMSKMTFTHEMSRLFLVEQVYRAFTIMEGSKYHK